MCGSQFNQAFQNYTDIYNFHVDRLTILLKYYELTGNDKEVIFLINQEKEQIISLQKQIDRLTSMELQNYNSGEKGFSDNAFMVRLLGKYTRRYASYLKAYNKQIEKRELVQYEFEKQLAEDVKLSARGGMQQTKRMSNYSKRKKLAGSENPKKEAMKF